MKNFLAGKEKGLYNKKKIVFISIIAAYLLAGSVLFARGSSLAESRQSDGKTITLSADMPIAQRILGNDYRIQQITFYIAEQNISDDVSLDIYLTQGDYDLNNTVILEKVVYNVNQLKNRKELCVSFPQTKLVYNKDYYIVFKYTDNLEGASIELLTNGDNGGIYSGEADYGLSLAYDVNYASHYNKLLFVWQITFIFGSIIIAFCIIKKIYFWNAAAVTCILSALWMYCFGILGLLKYGFVSLFIIAAGAFLFNIVYMIKKPLAALEGIWKTYIRGGWICWCIFIVLYLLTDSGKIIRFWDELSHWGLTVQDMYMFDSFPIHEKSNVLIMRYPALYPVFQYLFLCLYGKYSAGIMHFAKHFFEISLIASCLEGEKNKKLSILAVIVFCIGLPEVFFSEYMVGSLYNDITIGLAFGYVLVQLWKFMEHKTKFYLFTFVLGILTCILYKDTGLVYILVMVGGIICILLYQILEEKRVNKNWILLTGITVLTVLIGEFSWHGYYLKTQLEHVVVQPNTSTSFATATGISEKNRVIEYLTGNGEPYQYYIIPEHIKKLLFQNDFSNQIFDLSFVIWGLIICALLWYLVCKNRELRYRQWMIFVVSMFLGIIVAFQLLYTFTFSQKEALIFASEDRYLGAFLIGIILLLVCILQKVTDGNTKWNYNNVMLCVCIIVAFLTNFCVYYRNQSSSDNLWIESVSEDAQRYSKALQLRHIVQEKEKVYFISKGDSGYYFIFYRYYLMPAKLNPEGKGYYPVTGEPADFQFSISAQEWREILKEYDYLFIDRCDEKFTESYGVLFEDIEDIEDGGLYRISPENDKILRRYTTLVAEN